MLSNECEIVLKLLGDFAEYLAHIGMTCPPDVLAELYYHLNVSPALLNVLSEAGSFAYASTTLPVELNFLLYVVQLPVHAIHLFLPLSRVNLTLQNLIVYLFAILSALILVILAISGVRVEEVDLGLFSASVLHSVLLGD